MTHHIHITTGKNGNGVKCGVYRTDVNGYFKCDGCNDSKHFTELVPDQIVAQPFKERPLEIWPDRLTRRIDASSTISRGTGQKPTARTVNWNQ